MINSMYHCGVLCITVPGECMQWCMMRLINVFTPGGYIPISMLYYCTSHSGSESNLLTEITRQIVSDTHHTVFPAILTTDWGIGGRSPGVGDKSIKYKNVR